jgi:hypothetical protein
VGLARGGRPGYASTYPLMEETHPRPERPYLLLGATALVALTFLLPPAGTLKPPRTARIAAYALVLVSVVPLLHGFLLAARSYATSRLLALGAAAAALGVLFALPAPKIWRAAPGYCSRSRCPSPTFSESWLPHPSASRSPVT